MLSLQKSSSSKLIQKLNLPNSSSLYRSFSRWSPEKEKNLILPKSSDIINEKEIWEVLESTKPLAKDPKVIEDILEKAKERSLLKGIDSSTGEFVQGLSLKETATLLNVDVHNHEFVDKLLNTALSIKERIYGNRIVLFAPLYTSNFCLGSCKYCGYRVANKEIHRNFLSNEEIEKEVAAIQKIGHKRILMLCGEHPKYPFERFLEAVQVASKVKTPPHGDVRRINIEIPALSVTDMKRLKATNCVGTVALFQETYHRETFKDLHPYGPKSDYDWRLLNMDRANLGGIGDVGLGALFGLFDYRFEVLSLLQHAIHLENTYNSGPHTISIPRLRPAKNTPYYGNTKYLVDDPNFIKLVAILRVSVPYTGMILSTRESQEMRKKLMHIGISQMSAGSRTNIGSYNKKNEGDDSSDEGQFTLADLRPTDEVIRDLLENGYLPSFCTACYRLGRTGEEFMSIAKRGDIHNFCHPNGILTVAEYLHDYASQKTQDVGFVALQRELLNIPNKNVREKVKKQLKQIETGVRDVYW
ncbi:biotin and thiamine synthesis associated domain containing protein [Anaeramoeba flamelloides]|uniref:Biotin and thiamine synthesis associated domain containing protein n=1 Tax=Anaeramoeba flamelloides TaxID=1746091 RepID=A0AAV7YYG6_9EUKA|nr:biotin and thiamine synthesis associated domain containing protein [Anaeramoeba flamelloides]